MTDVTDGRATIFEVADTAGVSITTVSHVFSGKRHINEETRRRVLEVADQLRYRPRGTAQALATGRTNTLALQISVSGEHLMLNDFFTQLLPVLSLAAVEHGYSFIYVPPRGQSRSFLGPLLDERRVDGAVLVDPMVDDPFVRGVIKSEVPFVSIGRVLGSDAKTWVDNDHAVVCRKTLEHLAERGYERPALLTIRSRKISYVLDYVTSFRAIADEPARVVTAATLSERAAQSSVVDALTGSDPPDAFLCTDDRLAVGACLAATELGLVVPDDLGIVGIGDGVLAARAHPPLTSVKVFPALAAEAAITMLDGRIRGIEVEVPVVVPTKLMRRESTASRR